MGKRLITIDKLKKITAEFQAGEPVAVRRQRGLVVRAALDVVEHDARASPAGDAAQILDRPGAVVDGAQDIGQHDLPVHPREMLAEEGLHDLGLVGFIPPLHLAPQAAAGGGGRAGQGGEGQHRTAGQIAGQQEPAGRAV